MENDGVVLLHGICRTRRSMVGITRFLERGGMSALNISYPSTKYPLQKLVEIVHPRIEAFAEATQGKVHFVGYSMGGLLIRAYLAQHRPAKLGRVVMLGTPNQGSEVADFMKDKRIYRWIYGVAGQQLVTDQSDFAHHFGQVDYELGVIAGSRSLDPISSYIIRKPSDGKVSIESTRVEGMRDHVVIPVTHTFFPSSKSAQKQTLEFLKEGRFAQ